MKIKKKYKKLTQLTQMVLFDYIKNKISRFSLKKNIYCIIKN